MLVFYLTLLGVFYSPHEIFVDVCVDEYQSYIISE